MRCPPPSARRPGKVAVLLAVSLTAVFGALTLGVDGGMLQDNRRRVKARAVARGRWVEIKDGIIVLDLHQSESLKSNGNGSVSVTNADIIVNSDDPSSVGGDGTGSVVKVTNGNFDLRGGVKGNTILQGTVQKITQPVPDPLAYLPEPALPSTALTAKGMQPNSANASSYVSALGLKAKDVNGQVYVLEPGRYD